MIYRMVTWGRAYLEARIRSASGLHSMLSVAEGGVGRVLACIRMRGCLASVIWGDLVKVSKLRK